MYTTQSSIEIPQIVLIKHSDHKDFPISIILGHIRPIHFQVVFIYDFVLLFCLISFCFGLFFFFFLRVFFFFLRFFVLFCFLVLVLPLFFCLFF